MPTSYVTKCTG